MANLPSVFLDPRRVRRGRSSKLAQPSAKVGRARFERATAQRPTQGLGLRGFAEFSGHLKSAFALGDRSEAGCIVGDFGD